jgi:small-conductance mechanosensitive channel/CRP-like cAMP-binding protein
VRSSVLVGLALVAVALGLRRATVNRHIRGRLLLSASLFAVYTLTAAGLAWLQMPGETRETLQALNRLLAVFAAVTIVVALSINPWRVDRVPDRFPNIVQDTLVIALFTVIATLIMRDRVLATTAVGAVVIGLALQDTLGNLFAGLAIQIEKPFRVGDWVTIGGQHGLVSEVTWRATKMRTKAGNFVVVPNSVLAKDTITNYCEPTRLARLHVDVGASYDTAPNAVKAVIREALHGAPYLFPDRNPEVLLLEFAGSAITYRVHFWVTDFGIEEEATDLVRTRIYYAFKRSGITIPYPIQVEMSAEEGGLVPHREPLAADALAPVALFSTLTGDERAQLLSAARPVVYSTGEHVVRQGQHGGSLFVVVRGEAAVTLAGTDGEVARLRGGDVFGEMSMLTGDPRTATVSAVTDCQLLELSSENFRRIVVGNPSVLDRVAAVAAVRREELARHREAHATVTAAGEVDQSLLRRIRDFLRL